MISSRQREALSSAGCQIAFDDLTRKLYASDASHYQIEPAAVAFPRNSSEASSIIGRAVDSGLSVIPRGAGTGLVGGALGPGLIVEFARFNSQIRDLDLERRSVRAGAGVVLDQLNALLKPHGYCFGPDVATSSRATIGGMIANNSSGSHVPVYGTTADHVLSLELVMADGRIKQTTGGLPEESNAIDALLGNHAAEIRTRMPPGLLKRWPGYGLDRALRAPGNLHHVLAGSEGTLAAISSAELKIVPLPKRKGLAVIFFESVQEAMQATVELLDLKAAAIEHIDRVLLDQTKGQLAFKAARDLLELDDKPCEALLVVEFYDDIEDKLAMLAKRKLGLRTTVLTKPPEMALVWALRKAGLSLLTGRKGSAKPVTGIEDTAVRPEQLPEYVAGLQRILTPLAAETCFYGHAAAGLLHVRPVLDIHRAEDLKKFRQIAVEVSALVAQFKGSLAAEHGVGMARTEFMREHLGETLLNLMRDIKTVFDPKNVFNPGKIFGDSRFKIDRQLRPDVYSLQLGFQPVLAFAARDESFAANLEQCNGCGGCRKQAPTMCPTFVATGEEIMSTRGRANAIRAVLELRGNEALISPELDLALSNCLSCKACTVECPSNVNMALLKAELLHARHRRNGMPLRDRLVASADILGRIGTALPSLANASLRSKLLPRLAGLATKRPLPCFTNQRFGSWFYDRVDRGRPRPQQKVLLWDDTFVRYHEPHIGKAAVAVLEAAGCEVTLLKGRQCCGRPAFSTGHLDRARRLGEHNLTLLSTQADSVPIIFLEPSCYSMFVEDYRELKLPGADKVASRCMLFEQFIDELLKCAPDKLQFKPISRPVAIHAHCHAKSLLDPSFMPRLAERVPEQKAWLLDTGCCGMAGAFGMLEDKYELSLKVAAPLVAQLNAQPSGTVLVASGTSCRHQIEHLTRLRPKHMAEVLADALNIST